jgi:hypothetical protein
MSASAALMVAGAVLLLDSNPGITKIQAPSRCAGAMGDVAGRRTQAQLGTQLQLAA